MNNQDIDEGVTWLVPHAPQSSGVSLMTVATVGLLVFIVWKVARRG